MVRILFGKPVCYKFTLLHTFTFTRTAFVNSFPRVKMVIRPDLLCVTP